MEDDIYINVTSQIRDVVRDDLSEYGLDGEKQKKIVKILKNNFNKNDEQMGRILMSDVCLFDPNTGDTIDVSLFLVPIVIMRGFRPITLGVYPNYDIRNEYMGYTDGGIFHKIKKASKIKRFLRSDIVAIVYIILAIILLIVISR